MPIRITGLNSGLDTESIISALVSSYSYKTSKYKKAQTKLSWKQDAWKSLNTKIYSLYNSVGNFRFSSAYNLKSATSSDSTKVTVSAGTTAASGAYSIQVTSLAKAGYLTGGKLASNTTTGTTLAELGYTGGEGQITLTKGDGTTESIAVNQGTTVSSFINSLKEAGVSANYDETNKRIYVSSKNTGQKDDFTLTGANMDGVSALSKLGLNVSSDATSATYESYTQYITGGNTSADAIKANVLNAVNAYNTAKQDSEKASGQNSNLSAAYSYASAYAGMQDTLNNSGLSEQEKTTLVELMRKSEAGRQEAVTDANGRTYTKSGTDADGNTIYQYEDGSGNKSYIKAVTQGDTTTYYAATAREEGTGFYKYEDANGVIYTQDDTGKFAGSDGKKYRLDGSTMIEINADGNDVSGGATATVGAGTEIQKTVYDQGAEMSGAKTASDTLKELTQKAGLSEEDAEKLKSNIATVDTYKNTKDTLEASDSYSRASIINQIESEYASGGASAVSAVTATYGNIIAQNAQTIETAKATMQQYQNVSELDATDDAAVNAFVAKVQSANDILQSSDYNTDAKKIDGQDATIYVNGIEYTGSSNAFTINGLTVTANAITNETYDPTEKTAVNSTVSADVQGVYDKIKDFLTQYNALMNEMNKLYNAASSKGYEPLTDEEKDAMSDTEVEKWEEKIKSSLLRRDDTLQSLLTTMSGAMSKGVEIDGKNYYLSSFGIKTLGYLNAAEHEEYAYHIDGDEDDVATSGNADKLMAAITNDPDTVMKFMQELSTNLYDAVDKKMKSTTLSSVYTVYNDKEMASEYSDYTDLISKWEEKLTAKEDYYYKKFSAMETALAKLNSSSSSLTNLFG